jgi:membrane-associated phospholipid phosphatase
MRRNVLVSSTDDSSKHVVTSDRSHSYRAAATSMVASHSTLETGDGHQHVYSAISPSTTVAMSLPTTSAAGADSLVGTAMTSVSYWHSRDGTETLASIIFFVVCCLVPLIKSSTHQRPIPYQLLSTGDYARNLSFNEIFEGDTVSDGFLIVLGMIVPFAVQYAVATMHVGNGALHATICTYLVAFGINIVCTDLVKSYCGYLRPMFYSACQPGDDGGGSYDDCTNGNVDGARRSFPSGHASISFCGLTLLTLFLHTRFGVPSMHCERTSASTASLEGHRRRQQDSAFDESEDITATGGISSRANEANAKDPFRYRCNSILALAPMGLALFIAASRVVDNRHFPADVVGGSLLGASIANYVHSLWS